jgi:hypothetical protein
MLDWRPESGGSLSAYPILDKGPFSLAYFDPDRNHNYRHRKRQTKGRCFSMKKVLGLLGSLFLVVAFVSAGLAGSEMKGNVSGEIVKIDGEMVHVKDAQGKVRAIHVDPGSTKKSGKLKVGEMVGADVTSRGHANAIWVMQMKGNVSGEIVKISGDMVDVKDDHGNIQSVHVDPVSTKKSGTLKVGAMVGANVTPGGHANSIWVIE